MYDILVKYKIITVLPMRDSFYFSLDMPENVKMSDELLKLNYSHHSPYPNPEIISYYDGVTLHMWFYVTPLSSLFIIPEAYLLYQGLEQRYQNDIVVLKEKDYKIFIIKESRLLSAQESKTLNQQMLALSLDEYNLKSLQEITESQTARELIEKNPNEIVKWKNASIKLETVGSYLINKFAYPLAFLLGFILLMQFIHGNLLTSDVQALEQEYREAKVKNDDIREYINEKKKIAKEWGAFLDEELIFPDVMMVLKSLLSAVDTNKITIQSITIVNGIVDITVEGDSNPVLMLNRLVDLKLMKNVTIKRSYKPKNSSRVVVYEMELTPVGVTNEL